MKKSKDGVLLTDLRKARLERDLYIRDVIEATGMTLNKISLLERGYIPIEKLSLKVIRDYAVLFNMSIHEFIDEFCDF